MRGKPEVSPGSGAAGPHGGYGVSPGCAAPDGDLMPAAEEELRARLRALRAEMPRRGVGTVFPEVVRARARRHRSRVRAAGGAALVVAVVLGVGVPVSLTAGRGGAGGVSPAVAAHPAHTFGGMTVTWLPAGMSHDADLAVQVSPGGNGWSLSGPVPPLTMSTHLVGQTSFISHFTTIAAATPTAAAPATASNAERTGEPVPSPPCAQATPCAGTSGGSVSYGPGADLTTTPPAALSSPRTALGTAASAPGTVSVSPGDALAVLPGAPATTAVTGAPAALWATVTWQPDYPSSNSQLSQALSGDGASLGVTRVSTTTLGGQPALFVETDQNATAGQSMASSIGGHRYGGLLTWVTPGGARLAVESTGDTPADLTTLRQVGAGLLLGQQPPNPAYTPQPVPGMRSQVPPDEATAVAVKAAFHDVFTHDVTPAQFTGALQDGPALRAVSDEVVARFPQLGHTIEVTVTSLDRQSADTVSAGITLSFTDPTVPSLLNHTFPYKYSIVATAVRTSGGWKVSRDSYCSTVSALGVQGLACPPA